MKNYIPDRMINFTHYDFNNLIDSDNSELLNATLEYCIKYHFKEVLKLQNIFCKITKVNIENDDIKMTYYIEVMSFGIEKRYFAGFVKKEEMSIGEFTKGEYEHLVKIL